MSSLIQAILLYYNNHPVLKRSHIACLYNTHPDNSPARSITHKPIVSTHATIHYINHREKKKLRLTMKKLQSIVWLQVL